MLKEKRINEKEYAVIYSMKSLAKRSHFSLFRKVSK